ncbi:hypothetical protein [Cupriavidus necator]|uniref:hypothetical protein n=1 Tax=Cupriavidus necator TaxID=106590 RepID=UPI0002EE78A2|nr:hypothetical protein [Cupriavidus necator]MDX6011307.1 hypothetical protein [Cupriavidus necator]
MPPEVWEKRDAFSRQRFEQLNGIVVETATDGIKFLATINLGGLGAVLAFMGSMKIVHPLLSWGGAAFMCGLFEVGAIYLYRYTYMAWLLDGWNEDYKKVLLGRWEWVRAIDRDERRQKQIDWGAYIAVLSLLLFLAGAWCAFQGAYDLSREAQAEKAAAIKQSKTSANKLDRRGPSGVSD